jgi:class 3 adenylate cyclase
MNNYTTLTLLLLLALITPTVKATDINVYGFEMGLSHRNVLDIAQDDSGFLWIGTVNGLNRFDGYTFVKYDLEEVLGRYDSHAVYEINFDANKNLILSLTNRIVRVGLDGEVLQYVDFGEVDYRRGEERQLRNLVPKDGGWWAILENSENMTFSLVELDENLDIKYTWDLGLLNDVSNLVLQDDLLFFTENYKQLKCFNTKLHEVSEVSFPGVTATFIEDDAIRLIDAEGVKSLDGQLIKSLPLVFYEELSKYEGLKILPQGSDRLVCFSDKIVFAFDFVDNSIELLYEQINNTTGHEVVFHSMFVDEGELLWISSDFGALSVHFDSHDYVSIMSGGDILCSSDYCSMRGITKDPEGNIYCSFYNGIATINTETNKPVLPGLQINDDPYALLWHSDKLFSGSGLVVDLKSKKIIEELNLEEEGVLSLFSVDSLYLFNGGQIFLWQESSYKEILEHPYLKFTYAKADPQGNYIILGTRSNGLWLYDVPNNKLIESDFNKGNSGIVSRRINVVDYLFDNQMLVGTDKGIFYFQDTDLVKLFDSEEEGVPNSFINGMIVEKDQYLWFSTDKGLACIDLGSYEAIKLDQTMIPFSEYNRISFADLEDGSFIFGGLNGMVRFDPEHIRTKQQIHADAHVMISKFRKFDGRADSMKVYSRSYNYGDTINIEYYDSFFQIDFASTAFENPKLNNFSYRLSGYDKDWIDVSDLPNARYNFVPAGKYKFEIKGEAFGAQGKIQPFLLNVHVEKAFYKELWFIFLVLFLSSSAVIFLVRLRLRRIQRRAEMLEKEVVVRTQELQVEKQKSEELLLNILPYDVAEELKESGISKAKKYNEVTVLFADFKGFTKIASVTEPEELVSEIDYCFRAFDEIITRHDLEKIKTIGDAYLCVGGIHDNNNPQANEVVLAALEIQAFMEERKYQRSIENLFFFEIRLGLHTGPIVAGIVGLKKFAFDIWGDTVNTASHIESSSAVGCVNISEDTYKIISEDFECSSRGEIEIKNKGPMSLFFVNSIKPDSPLLNIYNKDAFAEDFN